MVPILIKLFDCIQWICSLLEWIIFSCFVFSAQNSPGSHPAGLFLVPSFFSRRQGLTSLIGGEELTLGKSASSLSTSLLTFLSASMDFLPNTTKWTKLWGRLVIIPLYQWLTECTKFLCDIFVSLDVYPKKAKNLVSI